MRGERGRERVKGMYEDCDGREECEAGRGCRRERLEGCQGGVW